MSGRDNQVTVWELDVGGIFASESDYIGDVTIPESPSILREQTARLPQSGSEYNGIYVLTYDVVPLD